MEQKFLAEFTDGGPGCMRDDCMVSEEPSSTTLAYYPPVYNSEGVNINPNMNKTHKDKRCLSCGKSWTEVWQNGTRLS